MKCLRRNTGIYYYATYTGKTEAKDENGYYTGESAIQYSDVKRVRGVLSAVSGTATVEMFGPFKNYDAVLVTDDISCDMDENSVLYTDADKTAVKGIVRRVSRTPNTILYAIGYVEK